MESAAEYLERLYKRIKPKKVVEIGSDPRMSIAARTGDLVGSVVVVDFEDNNDYKRGWWEMHREMGIPLVRIDGNACELSSLLDRADVVYCNNVLFELNHGDTEKSLDYRRGKIELSGDEVRALQDNFNEAELAVLEESCKLACEGHVIWFHNDKTASLRTIERFQQYGRSDGRKLLGERVLDGIGELPDAIYEVRHLAPIDFHWDSEYQGRFFD